MRLPFDVIISPDKLSRYLLVFREKNDKSGFLNKAGFTLDEPEKLEDAIRKLISEHELETDGEDEYGQYVRVEGSMTGPNGHIIEVVTIWMQRTGDETYRFITLKPKR
ncbi:MAG TPA: hypothetical protein PLQ56_04195 [Aggregatilineales bacterium]|nr:hypothetical protein [Aggregatilineales bacterium]